MISTFAHKVFDQAENNVELRRINVIYDCLAGTTFNLKSHLSADLVRRSFSEVASSSLPSELNKSPRAKADHLFILKEFIPVNLDFIVLLQP